MRMNYENVLIMLNIYFIFQIIIQIFTFPFLSLQLTINLPCCFSNLWHLFINCSYSHICICVYTYILKYMLLIQYNVTHMYVLRDDHLVLNNLLMCFFLWKTFSSPLNIPQLSVSLCKRSRPQELSQSTLLCLVRPFFPSTCLDSHY